MPKKGKMVKAERDTTGGRSKKTRAKAKNVTQTVIVNVGKRGGGKSATAPPVRSAPTPLQQALQLLQTQRQPPQGESLIQSTQILPRMIEPINRRLEVLMRQPSQVPAINITQPPINIAQPAISVTQPPINVSQPAINFPPINITQPPINVSQPAINFPPINVSQPAINISSMQPQALPLVKPQASMASQTEAPQIQAPLVQGIKPFQPYQLPQTPLSYRDYVLDLPDAPLVEPAKPLVPGGSLRLDPEHEDVPIVRPVVEEKEEEKYEEEVSSEEPEEVPIKLRDDYSRVPLTLEVLDKFNFRKSKATVAKPLTIEGLYSYHGLPFTTVLRGNKQQAIANLIRTRGQSQ